MPTIRLTLAAVAVTAVSAEARLPTMASVHGRMPCGSCAAPSVIASRAMIASKDEPGERLVVSGDVYETDGATRAVNVVLFLYQTDGTGLYNQPNDPLNPRLFGWVRTDSSGHYEFETVRPAAYPSHTEAAHIHVHVYGPNRPEWFIEECRFDADPLLPASARSSLERRGKRSPVIRLSRGSAGAWRGVRDIRLESPRSAEIRSPR